jgi:hypothetical protein
VSTRSPSSVAGNSTEVKEGELVSHSTIRQTRNGEVHPGLNAPSVKFGHQADSDLVVEADHRCCFRFDHCLDSVCARSLPSYSRTTSTWFAAVRREELYTVPIGIQQFMQQYATDWGSLMAAATMALLPTFVLFLFIQKDMMYGAIGSGVKG